jgi:positive regulator of sigma E activity
MQCFRHQDRAAIAVCRHCGKAACADCSEDTGQGIGCSPDCAAEIQDSFRLRERLRQSYGIGYPQPVPASVFMYGLFGLILMLVGVYLSYSRHSFDYLTFAMAAVFFVMSFVSYRQFRATCQTC